MKKSHRVAEKSRKTRETEIRLKLNLDGEGKYAVTTGVPFFDHMLEQLSRHSGIDLEIEARGDIEIDAHHTVEDVGIVLGQAFSQALGEMRGIQRYGYASVPMEEALAHSAVDLCGRSNLIYHVKTATSTVGNFDTELAEEFFRAFVSNAKITLHVNLAYGNNQHHILEAVFKSVARSLRMAVALTGGGDVPSTKGVL
ncbi:imidazoleglycerol-phosphate dehydratase HisB [bacterium]|nr:imidazoleglycerol-phosphate dehydratase HisB [bacterium]